MIVFPMENCPPGLYRTHTRSGTPPWVFRVSASLRSSRFTTAPTNTVSMPVLANPWALMKGFMPKEVRTKTVPIR